MRHTSRISAFMNVLHNVSALALFGSYCGGFRRQTGYYLSMQSNVLGGKLQCCCQSPMTGFYRDGYCKTGPGDVGLHTVCIEANEEFLKFSKIQGNDLTTPAPEWEFPGLKPGDRWCLCVTRWKEALDAGVAPRVLLAATHISALEFVDLDDLKQHALDDIVDS